MGVYWHPVNMTTREYIDCTSNRVFKSGPKFGSWNHPESDVWQFMVSRWGPHDDVRAVADSGSSMNVWGQNGAEESPDFDHVEAQGFTSIAPAQQGGEA